MERQYLELLPASFQRMAEEIEELIGSEIVVRLQRPGDDLMDRTLWNCICEMRQKGASVSIVMPPGADIAPHSLVHELLHAHRNLSLAVPQLWAKEPHDLVAARFSSRIENDVEHLYIIPQEIEAIPEAADWWCRYYDGVIDGLAAEISNPARSVSDTLGLREALLRAWLVTSLCIPKWEGRAHLEAALTANDYMFEASKLSEKIKKEISDKASCLATVMRFAKLDPNRHQLVRFLVREQRIEQTPVPGQR